MKFKLTFLLSLLSYLSYAQFIEFGGGIGVMNYTGDLNSAPRLSQSRLAVQGIYTMNFSEVVSLKLALTAGAVSGDDEQPVDALGRERAHDFKHNILELSGAFEYYFLNYKSDKSRIKWSPYIFLGFGFISVSNVQETAEDFNRLQPVLPMGAGFKHLLGKRFCIGIETGARRTFFDHLDGISGGDQRVKDYQYGNPNDNDWFIYTGVSLTYILYKIPCPFPYVPNRSLFSR